jgi:hypothetical protein
LDFAVAPDKEGRIAAGLRPVRVISAHSEHLFDEA